MQSPDPRRDGLIAQIEAAFPEPGYPADRLICVCRCPECESYSESMRGRRWHDVVVEKGDPSGAFALLEQDALAYFLPGLATVCLLDPYEAEWTLECSIYNLAPEDAEPDPAIWSIFEGFSKDQRTAIYTYLDWAVSCFESMLGPRIRAANRRSCDRLIGRDAA